MPDRMGIESGPEPESLLVEPRRLYDFHGTAIQTSRVQMLTKSVAVPEGPIDQPTEPQIKKFPSKPTKVPVDPRAVAAETLTRYAKTMARLAK